jgi:hypothetical protein
MPVYPLKNFYALLDIRVQAVLQSDLATLLKSYARAGNHPLY